MADGGGNGGVRRRPEPLGHRRWIGGIEGGAVEERARHSGVDEGDGAKKGNIGGPACFMVARWRGREEKGQGVPGFSTAWREKQGRAAGCKRLTGGVGRRRARWASVGCERERRKQGNGGIGR
jgi:hypothetical protein